MMSGTEIKTTADLTYDQNNARRHNPRNIGLIEHSISQVGMGRSIVIDENGRILAGNGTVEAAGDRGITKVRVIEADGEEIIAVQRKGLTEEQKTKLSLSDNRTAELADWDPGMLHNLDPDILNGMFTPDELESLMEETPGILQEQETLLDQAVQLEPPAEYIVVKCENEDDFIELRERLGLNSVRRGGYKKGSSFDQTGIERVVKAEKLLGMIK